MVPVDSIAPDPRNARLHDERNLEAIRRSLEAFGQRKPLVVWRHSPGGAGRVTKAGSGTLEAARRLGWASVWVAWADGLTEAEADAYALADNRTAELASWDPESLRSGLASVGDLAPLTGFSAEEVGKILAAPAAPQAPASFPEVGEDVPVDHTCPRCGFAWSGQAGIGATIEPGCG